MRKALFVLSLLVLLSPLLAACNTMEGVGRDISATGRWITGTADRAQN
jgi:predicted small secreted protein